MTTAFIKNAERNPQYKKDVSVPLDDAAKVKQLLVTNPIQAWIGGKGTGGEAYFSASNEIFRTIFDVQPHLRESFADMVREIIVWRLGQYLGRASDDENGSLEEARQEVPHGTLEPWREYSRSDIPQYFGAKFNPGRDTGAAPFIYCGSPTFQSWEGETPITVFWKLPSPIPIHLRRLFGIDGIADRGR